MAFDYFYGPEDAAQYSFYRIPKTLITGELFQDVSVEAKLLYGLMLDRLSLSLKNGWFDSENRAYIIYTIEDIMADLHCGNQKAVKLLSELEKKAGLIRKKRQGLGKPSLIYVLKFYAGNPGSSSDSHLQKCDKHTSGNANTASQEMWKSQCNDTDLNKTDYNKPDPINQRDADEMDENDPMTARACYEAYFKDRFEIDALKEKYPYDKGRIQEILDLCVDTVCSRAETIRISGEKKPAEIVKGRFLKLNSDHVEYIINSFHDQVTDIRNIKQYMMTMLYNAPLTMEHYYSAKARHDMANWKPDKEKTEGGDDF